MGMVGVHGERVWFLVAVHLIYCVAGPGRSDVSSRWCAPSPSALLSPAVRRPRAWARGDSGPLYGDLVALLEECRWSWCGSALLVASLPIARSVVWKCSVPMDSVYSLLLMCELQFVASGVLEWLPCFLAGSGESSSAFAFGVSTASSFLGAIPSSPC